MSRNHIRVMLLSLPAICFQGNAIGEYASVYRDAHEKTCYEIGQLKIACGNFDAAGTVLAKQYDTQTPDEDVMDSFSASSHPGDHPFLKRLAKRLGYFEESSSAEKSVFYWETMSPEEKQALTERFSKVVDTPEMRVVLSGYLSACLDYWTDPQATHNPQKEDPTLAEVSALCVADSGVLQ